MTAATLRVDGLGFEYRRHQPVVSGLSHTFADGAVTAVTGPSGCGKSTLLYLAGLLLRPTEGEVVYRGRPVGRLPDAERASLRAAAVGFVFQDAALDPARTVLDNVTEGALYRGERRAAARRRGRELLEQFGVLLRADHRPGEVSGGQAQRVALCRALLGAPSIVLADEPTGNLDAASAATVIDALRARAAEGACVVVATHDEKVTSRCDQVLTVPVRA